MFVYWNLAIYLCYRFGQNKSSHFNLLCIQLSACNRDAQRKIPLSLVIFLIRLTSGGLKKRNFKKINLKIRHNLSFIVFFFFFFHDGSFFYHCTFRNSA